MSLLLPYLKVEARERIIRTTIGLSSVLLKLLESILLTRIELLTPSSLHSIRYKGGSEKKWAA